MNTRLPFQTSSKALIVACLLVLGGCADLNSSYPSNQGGYYDPNYGGYRDDGYYDRDRHDDRRERREIERERERLEEERRRLEQERYRNTPQHRPAPVVQDSCPPGFSPSEQKCSSDERRRGCKDIRTPSGLGCVKR